MIFRLLTLSDILPSISRGTHSPVRSIEAKHGFWHQTDLDSEPTLTCYGTLGKLLNIFELSFLIS